MVGRPPAPGGKITWLDSKTQGHALAIEHQTEATPEFRAARRDKARDRRICHIGGDITLLQLLVGRDLRQIDDVGNPDAIALEGNFGVVIDAEVAHGMGKAPAARATGRAASKKKEQSRLRNMILSLAGGQSSLLLQQLQLLPRQRPA